MLFFIAEAVGANSEVDDIRKAINLLKKHHLKKILKDKKGASKDIRGI